MQAASLLKRTEGLVTLIVSNPSKRPVTPSPETIAGLNVTAGDSGPVANNISKVSLPPSRAVTPIPGKEDISKERGVKCPLLLSFNPTPPRNWF